jgi:hypothetical protein
MAYDLLPIIDFVEDCSILLLKTHTMELEST